MAKGRSGTQQQHHHHEDNIQHDRGMSAATKRGWKCRSTGDCASQASIEDQPASLPLPCQPTHYPVLRTHNHPFPYTLHHRERWSATAVSPTIPTRVRNVPLSPPPCLPPLRLASSLTSRDHPSPTMP